jgi:hypothetical protein
MSADLTNYRLTIHIVERKQHEETQDVELELIRSYPKIWHDISINAQVHGF